MSNIHGLRKFSLSLKKLKDCCIGKTLIETSRHLNKIHYKKKNEHVLNEQSVNNADEHFNRKLQYYLIKILFLSEENVTLTFQDYCNTIIRNSYLKSFVTKQ